VYYYIIFFNLKKYVNVYKKFSIYIYIYIYIILYYLIILLLYY